MGSKVVVTYKRKRLFSRSDQSPINLHSPKPPEISESKATASDHKLPNKNTEFRTCYDSCKDNIRENLLQCENHDSQCFYQCSEQANESQTHCSSCTKQPNSLVLSESLFGIPKSGSESANNRQNGFPSEENHNSDRLEAADGINFSHRTKETSVSGTCSSVGDELLNNSITKRSLITFCRRVKRNRNSAANDTATKPLASLAASCSVELKEKKLTDETAKTGFSSNTTAEMVVQVDTPLLSPYREATKGLTTDGQSFQDLLNVNLISTRLPSNFPETRGSLSSLDLSISPPAVHPDIDCNISLACGSGGHHKSRPVKVLHDCLVSHSDVSKNTSSQVIDKGKFVVESLPVKNIRQEFQLFTENPPNLRSRVTRAPNHLPKTTAYYPLFGDWAHARPALGPANSLSTHLMMLDTILDRARTKFDLSTKWSEDELDCLWVGVRRHGVNNWAAILLDRNLQFSAWKTARDLDDRWRDEQRRLFHGGPVYRAAFSGPAVGHDGWALLGLHGPSPQRSGPRWRQCGRSTVTERCVNGNLPHWLREAVEHPPYDPARNIGPEKLFENTINAPIPRRTEQQISHKPAEVIGAASDASSEGTVSA